MLQMTKYVQLCFQQKGHNHKWHFIFFFPTLVILCVIHFWKCYVNTKDMGDEVVQTLLELYVFLNWKSQLSLYVKRASLSWPCKSLKLHSSFKWGPLHTSHWPPNQLLFTRHYKSWKMSSDFHTWNVIHRLCVCVDGLWTVAWTNNVYY